MRLFGRERETLRVEQVKVSRAVYESAEIQRAEITLLTEGNGKLILELTPDQLHTLIGHATNTYNAIRPPLRSGGNAGWSEMQ